MYNGFGNRSFLIGLVVMVGLFFVWLIFSRGEDDIKNYPSANSGVIVFGDSLAEGVGSTLGNDLFSVLSRKIGEPIKNYGVAGDTTRMALERLPAVLEDTPNPKVAIILLGGNDFLRKIPREETFANLATIIETFQESGSVVLLLGVRGGVIKDNFDKEFESLRDRYKTAYVSDIVGSLVFFGREYMFDSVHPNDAGYAKIAERVYPELKKITRGD